jgi:adenosylmethionine-8-amino-7-oxononanoate aminotransferase
VTSASPLKLSESLSIDCRNTGSEAIEAAMKLARQYFLELSPAQKTRTKFIARKESYHGTTLGALALGGHVARRAIYEPMLLGNISRVSYCNAYRGMLEGESETDYVTRLAQELDDEFVKQGPENVCAFVAEPIVGAVCISSSIHAIAF